MPIQLTLCSLCTRSRPEIVRSIAQLIAEFPHDLAIVEVECMAACDEVPAVMIEYDFYPQVTPSELIQRVRAEFAR